jgi:hypothetical protein
VHAGSALRRRRSEHEPPDERGPAQRHVLGEEGSQRESQDVDLRQVQRVDEGDGVLRHLRDRAGRGTAHATDAGVVEGDDPSVGGQRVHQHRVAVVEVSSEVHQQHQRRRRRQVRGTRSRFRRRR